jgi:uncharacterized protein (TIGR00288 family)
MANMPEVTNMAVFCDFENVALGVRDANYARFDIGKVLERLLLKGSIVVKKAYCDWERYKAFKAPMHEAAFELIEIPHVRQSGKNSADIRMVVDALDLCYTKSHVDTFVVISGDSDFSPLVSKLRENDKTVIGVGVKNSTSDLLIGCCDEFIYYDDLVREQAPRKRTARKTKPRAPEHAADAAAEPEDKAGAERSTARRSTAKGKAARATDKTSSSAPEKPAAGGSDVAVEEGGEPVAEVAEVAEKSHDQEERRQEALDLVLSTVEALLNERSGDEVWGSMVKQALKRRNPGFNESFYGFRSFNALLEAAQREGLLDLTRDDKSGGYRVRMLVPYD